MSAKLDNDGLAPGQARSHGPSYTDLLDAEKVGTPPAFLRDESYEFLGDEDLPVERYIGREFFDREVEKMWPRVWQFVCREEDIPNVGDTEVYELLDWSFLVVRTAKDRIQGFYNSCMHRGRKLRTSKGRGLSKFKCPFHGFEFGIDGSLEKIPCRWDFPHLNEDNAKLMEVRVETWAGFVFLNMDDDAPSLEDYLGILPEHFERWKLEDCYKVVHVAKVVHANWKLTAEAFMESFHAVATHPQILPYSADANSRYDVYGDNVNRNLTPMAVTSPHIEDPPSEQEILDALVDTSGRVTGEGAEKDKLRVAEGQTAREFMAQMNRELFATEDGYDYSEVSDAELLDALVYNVFPNFSPWGGFVPNIVYRWRPNGFDPDSCFMEVMFLKRIPKGAERPAPAKMRFLTDDQAWSEAEELGALGPIFDQDMGNLPYVQSGMKASKKGAVSLGNYQEIRIRHFHRTLDKYLND